MGGRHTDSRGGQEGRRREERDGSRGDRRQQEGRGWEATRPPARVGGGVFRWYVSGVPPLPPYLAWYPGKRAGLPPPPPPVGPTAIPDLSPRPRYHSR
jgi:hypothetical protein